MKNSNSTGFLKRRRFFLMLWCALWPTGGCEAPEKKDQRYVPPAVCAEEPGLPLTARLWIDDAHAPERVFDASGAALDGEGRLVSVDRGGNVVRRAHDGTLAVLAEGVAVSARGLAYLSSGELVVADAGRGALILVYPDGQSRILTRHLDSPHGLCVDRDDNIYVAERSRGAVSRVHPRTGQVSTVATGLPMSPAGLSFSPDYQTLYVVGDSSMLYRIEKGADGRWGEPRWFAEIPPGSSPCAGRNAWDSCEVGDFEGNCREDGQGGLTCVPNRLCAGSLEGQPCFDRGVDGTCVADGLGGLECQFLPVCQGRAAGDLCDGRGWVGSCVDDGSGGLTCENVPACEGQQAGDVCEQYGQSGFCALNEGSGLWCRIPGSCDGKEPGAACSRITSDGVCGLAEGVEMECLAPPDCEGLQAGDLCLYYRYPGVCVENGDGGLNCDYVPPCESGVAGDVCRGLWGVPGTCVDSGAGELQCLTPPACEGKVDGEACTEEGLAGFCEDNGAGHLRCVRPPVCPSGADGSACAGPTGVPGICVDGALGAAYCQSSAICAGLGEGDPCVDPALARVGACVASSGGLFCALDNGCVAVGQGCLERGAGGGGLGPLTQRRSASPGPPTPPPEGDLGVCELSDQGLLYCAPRGPCFGRAEGDACPADWGIVGICVASGDGALTCEEPSCCATLAAGDPCLTPEGIEGTCGDDGRGRLSCMEPHPCQGLTAGAACAWVDGFDGACIDDGEGGLICRLAPACADKVPGDACRTAADRVPGTCIAGAGDLPVCQPTPTCRGKIGGDACTAVGGFAGTCAYQGQGLDAMHCETGRPGGTLVAVSADACGNVYVALDGTRTLWRFTPTGHAQMVATDLRAPVTAIFWGQGMGGWGQDTLHLGHGGGAGISRIDLGIPGRPLVIPKRSDVVPPDGISTNLDDPCLELPDAPMAVTELAAPRGWHDVTWDDRGNMVGFNGTDLVAVSQGGVTWPVLSGLTDVQGLAALPDGTLVAATAGGVIAIAPNGAVRTLAPDLTAGYGVTAGPDGMIYVADHEKVHRIDPVSGDLSVFVDPGSLGQDWQPRTVAFDPDHSLMIIGALGDSVYVVALDEDLQRVGAPRRLGRVVADGLWLDALVVDSCGNLYVSNYGTSALYRVRPDGRSRLYHQWETEQYGHGGDWGVAMGGWRTDAIYLPQPYDGHTVQELIVGVPGAGR